MRYKFLLITTVLIIIIGCSNKTEEINQLLTDAEEQVFEGNFENAISIYDQILTYDKEKYEELLDKAKNEKKALKNELEKVKQFQAVQEKLYEMQKNETRSGINVSMTDMQYILKDLDRILDDLEDINEGGDTEIEQLVRNITNSLDYTFMKQWIDSDILNDAGLSEGLSHFDIRLKAQNSLITATIRNDVNDGIDSILSHELPTRYEK